VELAPVWLLIWWRVVDAEVKRIKLMNRYYIDLLPRASI
jgi:hypothetical protein